ncbi:hypothetical protein [Streptomyces avidinii]|uniref:Uncharacterized protein n=1 Tax=Streptomyces avidinii TaxID=1895 RepID=A0ABS4KWR0_STRAV|nr:hypothetical protein [Streptomyces avidinii]MBP2034450.1 hypothetical protein [Streptomyces avidinii]
MEYLVVVGIGLAWGLFQAWRGGAFGGRPAQRQRRSRSWKNDGVSFSCGNDASCGGGSSCGGGGD